MFSTMDGNTDQPGFDFSQPPRPPILLNPHPTPRPGLSPIDGEGPRSPSYAFEVKAVRKVDIAHSGQTVAEAMAQLKAEIAGAHRAGESLLLIVHGFGSTGAGGLIKAAMAKELPGLQRTHGFKAFSDKAPIPRQQDTRLPTLNPGSTLLIFREVELDGESKRDYRPNFRNLRTTVKVRASGKVADSCGHRKRKLVSRGPASDSYLCRHCGKIFRVPTNGPAGQG